jgi:hypothetical protein
MAITLEQAQAVHSAYIQREYHYQKIADGYMVKYQLGKNYQKKNGKAKKTRGQRYVALPNRCR